MQLKLFLSYEARRCFLVDDICIQTDNSQWAPFSFVWCCSVSLFWMSLAMPSWTHGLPELDLHHFAAGEA